MEHSERIWARRLRWRLRGAWQWPAYAVLTVLDAVILHELPPVRTGVDFVPALILASFTNLFLMGAVAPWLGRRLAAREQASGGNGVPLSVRTEILKDRTAAVLLGVATLGLLAAGLGNRPVVVAETEDLEQAVEMLETYVAANAPHEIQRNIETVNTDRLEEGYFRMCINYDERDRAWCVFVNVKAEPPTVKEDPARVPNLR
ncbi:MAG TPA: hypothetical protein VD790_08480 [Thermoleophilaceae bacterium]|nr:hypothetical protein [Thermoleophilaceae bacterium]